MSAARTAPDEASPGGSAPAPRRERLPGVDMLRGLAILMMVLDHCRDFFGPTGFSPTDLARTTAPIFFLRWLTHPGAPVFVLLAGASAYLMAQKGGSRWRLAGFLVSRGLWLILLEFTWVSAAWTFDLSGTIFFAQILWVMGISMLVLAWLVLCPLPVALVFGALMLAGHDLLDGVRPLDVVFPRVWKLLHVGNARVVLGEHTSVLVIYPLVPWIGVMALGYGFGRVLAMDRERRNRWCMLLGLSACVAFVGLRLADVYGEPEPWAVRPGDRLGTLMSFLNTSKYPPSLQFLLMSLGPPLLLLPWLGRSFGWFGTLVRTFGSVPMFLYLAHLPLIHGLAWVWSMARYGKADWWVGGGPRPDDYYQGLLPVFVATALMLSILYPLCRRFADFKRRHPDWWWLKYV